MPTYICNRNANDQGLYIVHEQSCDFLPAVDNRVNAKIHDTYQGAIEFLEGVNEGRGLRFSHCEHCCHPITVTTNP